MSSVFLTYLSVQPEFEQALQMLESFLVAKLLRLGLSSELWCLMDLQQIQSKARACLSACEYVCIRVCVCVCVCDCIRVHFESTPFGSVVRALVPT